MMSNPELQACMKEALQPFSENHTEYTGQQECLDAANIQLTFRFLDSDSHQGADLQLTAV